VRDLSSGAVTRTYGIISSPIGDLLAWGEGYALCGLDFADADRAFRPDTLARRDDQAFTELGEQLGAYFAGELRRFELELAPGGTTFQRRVWEALQSLPYGTTASYGELAAEIGSPRAVRAVGAANGRNPISIVIPCHRLLGADGSLTGYGGGLERKRWLLDHERASGSVTAL
jgi:methylated-DNA-[protein]-cysteine S-methyltransferase